MRLLALRASACFKPRPRKLKRLKHPMHRARMLNKRMEVAEAVMQARAITGRTIRL